MRKIQTTEAWQKSFAATKNPSVLSTDGWRALERALGYDVLGGSEASIAYQPEVAVVTFNEPLEPEKSAEVRFTMDGITKGHSDRA